MKKTIVAALVGLVGIARADVHFTGLYHNNTNLNAQTEAVPSLPTNTFLEVNYAAGNVSVYFLTESPAGNVDESVDASVRFYSNLLQEPGATFVTNVTLEPTNLFHGAVASGSQALDLWRVVWTPPHGFSGPVYYSPHVVTKFNGNQTDQQYLLSSIGGNVGAQWGDNSFFYTTNAQFIGDDPFGLDFSFVWTNYTPLNFDYFYFNNTGTALPQAEDVPGLGGTKFLEWDYNPTNPSYAYLVAPVGGLSSMQTRFYFVNGGGEIYRPGAFYTNVVISDTNQFHSQPASGAVTLEVWRTAFYPPAGWSNESVYYAHQITTPQDGAAWLVTDPLGTEAVNVTNNYIAPQYVYTGGPFGRDWGFTPTAGIVRASIQRDYLYHNNTGLNPQTEQIPSAPGKTFLSVNNATTTTTFYVITDHPANTIPGETVYVQIRIDYDNPEYGFSPQYYNMAFDQNLVITSTPGFHGLPVSGTHTVDLWRFDWPMPRSTNAPFTVFTNAFAVYYSPFIKTVTGQFGYQTDFTFLLANGTPNSYPVDPQYYGSNPFGNDFSYNHQFVSADADLDGLPDQWEQDKFGTTTNSATGDNDADGLDNLSEYIADTSPTDINSFFGIITNATRAANTESLIVNPSSTARVYDVYFATNLLSAPVWTAAGLLVPGNGGTLVLTFTNGADAVRYLRTGVKLP